MPSATTAPSAGDQLEARVAQTWFWEGFYVRRGVNFERYVGEPLQVTDLDLFAIDFDPHLASRRTIGEVKSGKGKSADKPLDRILWLAGLRSLVDADTAELTAALPVSDKARALGRALGVTAQHVTDLDRREADAVQGLADTGAHGVDSFVRESAIRAICKKDTDLERAFNYLRGEVLLLPPFMAAKQLLEVLRLLANRWTPLVADDHATAVRWLAAEAVSILTLNLVTIAGQATTIDRRAWDLLVAEQLAQGAVPAHQMRKLSDAVDKYLAGVLATAQMSAELRTQAIGAFLPQPPSYAEQFAELCWRLKTEATYARALPRQVDFLAFERLVRQREPHPAAVTRLLLANTNSARLIGLICAFLRGCGGSFEALDQALSAPVTRSGPAPQLSESRLADDA